MGLGVLQVPTQLSRLNNGVHHAKVVVTPKATGGWPLMPLAATFAFAVNAGRLKMMAYTLYIVC